MEWLNACCAATGMNLSRSTRMGAAHIQQRRAKNRMGEKVKLL